MKALELGETLMLTGLYSRTKDKYYDAYVSLNSDKESLAITPYSVPKHLLGRELSQEQIQALRIGTEVFVSGLTSKNGSFLMPISSSIKKRVFILNGHLKLPQS
jgi:hypothetical protein